MPPLLLYSLESCWHLFLHVLKELKRLLILQMDIFRGIPIITLHTKTKTRPFMIKQVHIATLRKIQSQHCEIHHRTDNGLNLTKNV